MIIKYSQDKTQAKGFTLIELMLVVAILGIIAAVAIPSYLGSIQKSRRTDATETLMRLAVAQENFYMQNSRYALDITGLNNGSGDSTQGYYDITASGCTDSDSIKTCFILRATAKSASVQADDKDCAIFTIDSHNKRSAKNDSGVTTSDCW